MEHCRRSTWTGSLPVVTPSASVTSTEILKLLAGSITPASPAVSAHIYILCLYAAYTLLRNITAALRTVNATALINITDH